MYVRYSCDSMQPRARHTRSRRDLLSMPWRSRPEAGGRADLRQILASSSTAVHIRQRASFARRDLQYASSAICMTASAAICFGFMAFIRQAKRGAARLKKSKHRPLLSCIQRGQTSEDLWNRESGIASSGSDKVISVAGSAYAKHTEYEMYEIPIPRVIRLSWPDGRAPASAPQGGRRGPGAWVRGAMFAYNIFHPKNSGARRRPSGAQLRHRGPVGRDVALDSAWSYDIKDRQGSRTLHGAMQSPRRRDAGADDDFVDTWLIAADGVRACPITKGVAQGQRSC